VVCKPRYMTAGEKCAEPHIDNGGRRPVLVSELTSKIGRLDVLRPRSTERTAFPVLGWLEQK